MQNKTYILPSKSSSKSFTLIELIIVIIIVGILAAVGITQYSKTVEKGRGAEARMILGYIRKLAYEYYLQNGTIAGITNADINVGAASNQVPGPNAGDCRSTNYFRYGISGYASNPTFVAYAGRCDSSGKLPAGIPDDAHCIYIWSDFSSGTDSWKRCSDLGHPDY